MRQTSLSFGNEGSEAVPNPLPILCPCRYPYKITKPYKKLPSGAFKKIKIYSSICNNFITCAIFETGFEISLSRIVEEEITAFIRFFKAAFPNKLISYRSFFHRFFPSLNGISKLFFEKMDKITSHFSGDIFLINWCTKICVKSTYVMPKAFFQSFYNIINV